MSDQEIGNTQTAPSEIPATPAGPSLEELQAKLADFERTREGLIRDLQSERKQRQELEAKLSTPPAPSPANQDVNGDELAKVLNPYIAPYAKRTEALEARYAEDKAMEFLVNKTGKTVEQINADTELQDKLTKTVRKWGISGNTYDMTTKAYKLMELEDAHNREVERARQARASETTSLPSGAPPATRSSAKEYSADEFNAMNPRQFGELSKTGDFRKVGDKFVYVPRS
jgi:DNA repair exonuclease SbcCD ATPase subunit